MQPELAIQAYLRNGATVAMLEALHAIKARPHGKYPQLLLFKYDQIASDFRAPIVQEARGIILDSSKNWEVAAFGYRKFHNFGETLAAPIDWATARVYEKLDGSLIQFYNYAGEWQVSTSGTPDAQAPINDLGMTFAQLFWETFIGQGLDLTRFDPGLTYMLELCAPENRVVVPHRARFLVLHGVRDLKTLKEEDPKVHSEWLRCPAPRSFELRDVEECLTAAKALNPLESEGYVVCDQHFNRVKIKSPAYVALHHSKDGLMNRRKVAALIQVGEADELATALDAFPELQDSFDDLKQRHESLIFDAEVVYHKLRDIEVQKDFAVEAREHLNVQSILFGLRKTRPAPAAVEAAARTYLASLTGPAYLRIIGVKD